MEIILLKDLGKLGDKHDVVTVKDGYGRNFLIPKGLALIANKTNLAKLDKIKADAAAAEEARLEEFKQMAAQIEGKKLNIGVKAGTSGKIFGSVSNIQIAAALKEQLGLEIQRKKIVLPEEIKELGTYQATLNLHSQVTSNVEFELIKE